MQTFEVRNAAALDEGNSCYFFRIPDEERKPFLFGDIGDDRRMAAASFNQQYGKEPSLVTNPKFAGVVNDPADAPADDYQGDAILRVNPLKVSDFFPTAPELIEKKIGLQPEAFRLP